MQRKMAAVANFDMEDHEETVQEVPAIECDI